MSKVGYVSFHRRALMGVSVLALAGAVAGISSAQAQTAGYGADYSAPPTQSVTLSNFLISVGIDQQLFGSTKATTKTATIEAVESDPGVVTLANSSIFATATGNRIVPGDTITTTSGSTYPTITLTPGAPVVDLVNLGSAGSNTGIGIEAAQMIAGTLATSLVTDSKMGATLDDFTSGTVTVTGNRGTATTTLNQNTPGLQVSGELPASFTGTRLTLTSQYDAGTQATTQTLSTASVAIVNAQTSLESAVLAGSGATIDGLSVGVWMTDKAASTDFLTDADLTVTGNAVAATYNGNVASNLFDAEAGGGTGFDGSVGIVSSQSNVETGTADATDRAAYVTNSQIGAFVTDLAKATEWTYTGALVLSDNAITASATGNATATAAGSGLIAGNAILFDQGLATIDSDLSSGFVSADIGLTDNLFGLISGALVVSNAQFNQGTLVNAIVDGKTSPVSIGTLIELAGADGAPASLTLAGNEISSSAIGSVGANAIAAELSGSYGTAAAVSSNMQVDHGTPILAETTSVDIGARIGDYRPAGQDGFYGSLTLSDNVIGATAQGNLFGAPVIYDPVTGQALDATVAIVAPSIAAGGGSWASAGVVGVSVTSEMTNTVTGGALASSLQAVFDQGGTDATVTATVSESSIGAGIGASPTKASVLQDGSSVTLSGNALFADAAANTAFNSVLLSGSNGAFSASVGNNQDSEAEVSASISDSSVLAQVVADPTAALSATMTLGDTTLLASATGNAATNALTVADFANSVLGPSSKFDWSFENNALSLAFTGNTAIGALVVASLQQNEDDVTASIDVGTGGDPLVAIDLVGGIDTGAGEGGGFSATVSGTQATAQALGSAVANTLRAELGNLTTASGYADMIATLANLQLDQGGSDDLGTEVQASITDVDGVNTFVGVSVTGTVHGTPTAPVTLTVSDNALLAVAAGNVAGLHNADGTVTGGNRLIVTGTSYVGVVDQINAYPKGANLDTAAMTASVSAEFALQNAQVTLDGGTAGIDAASRSASIEGLNMGIGLVPDDAGQVIDNAAIAVTGNSLTATARDNDALNVLALGDGERQFTTLVTTAVLQNLQLSTAAVQSSVGGTDVLGVAIGIAAFDAEVYEVDNSDITLTGNEVLAQAIANQAQSTLVAGALNVLGGSNWGGGTQYIGSSLVANQAYSLTNAQAVTDLVQATANATIAVTVGFPGLDNNFDGGSITVSDNAIAATARGNLAQNTVSLNGLSPTAGTLDEATAALASVQDVDNADGPLSAASSGTFALFATDVGTEGGGEALTLSDNTVSAAAIGNEASNRLEVLAAGVLDGIDGRGDASFDEVGAPSSHSYGAVGDFALLNYQELDRAVDARVIGLATVTLGTLGDSQNAETTSVTLAGNALTAEARGNSAFNVSTVKAASIGETSVPLTSTQDADVAISASVSLSSMDITVAGDVAQAAVGVSGNEMTALAAANSARNEVSASASGAIGTGGQLIFANSEVDTIQNLSAGGDYALLNEQSSGQAGVSASVARSDIGVSLGDAAADVIAGTSISLADNAMLAQANGNSATNLIALNGATLDAASGALLNQQGNSGGLVQASVGLTGGQSFTVGIRNTGLSVSDGPQTVSGNSLTALATANSAQNQLTAVATADILGGSTTAATADLDPSTADFSLQADYVALNSQTSASTVQAVVGEFLLGTSNDAATIDGVNTTVTGNDVRAQATANAAATSIALNSEGLGALAAAGNWQANAGTVSAVLGAPSVGDTSTVGIVFGETGFAVTNSPLTVSGNSAVASAGGNSASTALNATAGALDLTGTSVATEASVSAAGVVGATADYAVLNAQSNSAAISATVQNLTIGVSATVGTLTTASTPITVAGNSVVASAFGNSASNAIALSGLTASTASASLISSQINSASVSATVSGVQIGSFAGVGGGIATVSGNSIGATAVGNSVGSSVGVGKGL